MLLPYTTLRFARLYIIIAARSCRVCSNCSRPLVGFILPVPSVERGIRCEIIAFFLVTSGTASAYSITAVIDIDAFKAFWHDGRELISSDSTSTRNYGLLEKTAYFANRGRSIASYRLGFVVIISKL